MTRTTVVALAGVLALSTLSGCTWTPKTTKGAVIGGATGAALGAVTTRSAGGAVVGGGLGAAAGYYIAKNSYRCQKRNIFGQTYSGWCLK